MINKNKSQIGYFFSFDEGFCNQIEGFFRNETDIKYIMDKLRKKENKKELKQFHDEFKLMEANI